MIAKIAEKIFYNGTLQKAVKTAIRQAGNAKQGSCYSLRDSFATHVLQSGYDIRMVQDLPGHSDVNITMEHTHVLLSSPIQERFWFWLY